MLFFFLVLGAATSAIILYGFQRTQDNATERSREGLEDFGSKVVNAFVRLVADNTKLEFARAGEGADAGAGYMAQFRTSAVSTWDADRLVSGAGGMRYDPTPDRLADAWVPSFLADDPSAETRLRAASALDPLFPELLENVPNGVAAYFIGAGGEGRYYPPNGVQDVVPPDFDLWTVPGFADVRPDKNPDREVVWTAPYQDSAGQGLIASAIAPVYFEDEFVGVVGIDISLNEFIIAIDDIHPSENGYAFYIDRSGELLGTVHAADVEAALSSPEHDSLTQALDGMRAGETGTVSTSLAGEDVFVAYTPIEGLGGSLAFVAPVADIRDEANAAAVTASIADEGDRTFQFVLIAMGGLFVGGLAGASYLNRRVLIRPLQQLAAGTRAVAAGDL
ncbi:MAG TPA: cache domain-containing protein, partial [Hyphomicrobium sp.]